MQKFLIINPFGIGDCLFTTPIIRAIKEKYPDSFIGYWCNERVGGLLKNDPDIKSVFSLSRGDIKRLRKGLKWVPVLFSLIREIRRERFDIAFDFSLDSRYGLWSILAGIKRRIGFDYCKRGRFLTDKIELKEYSGRHVIEHNLELLKFIGIANRPNVPAFVKGRDIKNGPILIVSDKAKVSAKKMLSDLGIKPSDVVVGIAMGGGASWGKDAIYKQWGAKNFARVAEKLIKEMGVRIVLLGSAEERPIADVVIKNCDIASSSSAPRNDGNSVIDLTGKLDLEELAAIIKELRLLVCNDGGPLHMAAALCVKTVSVFGPVDEKVYGPYPESENNIVVKKDMQCRPCYKNFRFNGCRNDRRCIEDIGVDEVFEKAKKLI